MEELWPSPTPEVAEAIRSLCQGLLAASDELTDALAGPALRAQDDIALLSDASLVREDRYLNHSDLVQWLTSNIQHPGRRVDPYVGPQTSAYISDLVSRGITPDFAEGWRAALGVCWRRWLHECVAQYGTRPDKLIEILDISARSMVQYALDSVAALRQATREAATGNAGAEALALIQMISAGAPITEEVAELRLGYRMGRQHLAAVLWTDHPGRTAALDGAVAALRSGGKDYGVFVARASATSRWVWLSGAEPPDPTPIRKIVTTTDGICATIGAVGHGLDGFTTSHQDALAAQALVSRLGSDQRFTDYADVELIDPLTKDRASARRFVRKTLGPLADADSELRQTLLTYVQCGFNTTRAAAALYTHRNTVDRRVARANALSVVKVEDNPTHVGAALLVVEIAPDMRAPDSNDSNDSNDSTV